MEVPAVTVVTAPMAVLAVQGVTAVSGLGRAVLPRTGAIYSTILVFGLPIFTIWLITGKIRPT